jgi:Ras-related protein Rab-11A
LFNALTKYCVVESIEMKPKLGLALTIPLFGDSGVGKSNFLTRLTYDKFDPDIKPSTGFECSVKRLEVEGKMINAQILCPFDPKRNLGAGCHLVVVALLLYDISAPLTFQSLSG